MPTRRTLLQLGAALATGALLRWQLDPTSRTLVNAARAFASVQVPQTPLPGTSIPQYVEPLTSFVGRRVKGSTIQLGMFEFQQRILPDAIYNALPAPFSGGSYVWGYAMRGDDFIVGLGLRRGSTGSFAHTRGASLCAV